MKKILLCLGLIIGLLPVKADLLSGYIPSGMRNFVTLRVEFQTDNHAGTTGNGRFMLTEWTGHDTVYAIDPLPHNRAYFSSHLKFLQYYWQTASKGRISINPDDALLLPRDETAYILDRQMRYYTHPDSLDSRLAEFVYESVAALVNAGDSIPLNHGLIIFHAGVGQDFNIMLDDSPFDIPSFYFDEAYLETYLSPEALDFLAVNHALSGIVLPETQNQLNVNLALNGTAVLLSGMMLGLPPLYNTENGRSGVGVFGLMDQGSNNCNGLCPIMPSAFERILLDAATPRLLENSGSHTLLPGEIYRISLSSNEYFLLEYRKNTGIWADSLYWSDSTLFHYIDVLQEMKNRGYIDFTLENGVLTSLSDLDLSLPVSGLLIWHVCEPPQIGKNPNGTVPPLLDLVEADGGNDIGKFYNTLDPSVNNGWKWDIWFKDNPAWSDNNTNAYKMQFNDNSNPNTRNAAGLPGGINIRDFKFHADSLLIQLQLGGLAQRTFPGLVFDEMSSALPVPGPASRQLIGYRDSSLFLYDGNELNLIYHDDKPYVKGNVALMSYNNNIIQIVNETESAEIKQLAYNLLTLGEQRTTSTGRPLDLERIALLGDTLYLPQNPNFESSDYKVYKLELLNGILESRTLDAASAIPYAEGNTMRLATANAAVYMNDILISAQDKGFSFAGGPVLAPDYAFREILPLHMNNDGSYELLAVLDQDGQSSLAAFNRHGYLLDNFPVRGNYRQLRVYYLDGDPQILAYDPRGRIDVFATDAELFYSLTAPLNAASLFIEQITPDSAWIVADGSIYTVRSDSVYWGYRGKDAVHSNAHHALQSSITPVSEHLIRDALIYNYPNPAEGETTRFRFYATGAQQVNIQIFQLSGRYITTLNAGDLYENQWNEIRWDVSGLQSGVYIARIEISGEGRSETYFVKSAILK